MAITVKHSNFFNGGRALIKRLAYFAFLFYLFLPIINYAQSKDDKVCLECHGERTFTTTRNGKEISLFINGKSFAGSVHEEISCTGCHDDVNPNDLPHAEKLKKVVCANCHDKIAEQYNRSLHGVARAKGVTLAPTCVTCHSEHEILSPKNPKSKTFVMNIPGLCGSCHKEGTQVSKILTSTTTQTSIYENYSESIHGDGLYKRGLTVTAVCTSCHTAHDILPHTNPESTINRNNVSKTCMKCHTQIESVHQKIINGQLWEKQPNKIPVCIECHQPHKVRRVFYEDSLPNEMCMKCHSNKNLTKVENGKTVSLYVDIEHFKNSVHQNNSCVKCHTNVNPQSNPVCKNSGKVDCSICHQAQVEDYKVSIHGQKHFSGDKNAPYCTDCHTSHNVQSKNSQTSPTFSRNVPELCGNCHREGKNIATALDESHKGIVANYKESIHGKGLLQSGLLVTATCVDCHSSHKELPKNDPNSTVNPKNIGKTCAKCHLGVYEAFRKSIHSPEIAKTDKRLPVCNDCHFSHEINRVDLQDFRQSIVQQCGQCHQDVTETYFETFHGKVTKLGNTGAAKCFDCHGSHNILPASDINSTLNRKNIIQTCQKCHPNSNRKFVGYLTHATHHDRAKYPFLFFTYTFMVILLIGTFSFFGLHTLFWFIRLMKDKIKNKNKS